MFIIVLGQHVSILTESSSGHSKKIDPYLEMLKCAVGSQTLTFVIKLYKMHVLFCSCCTIILPISKTLTVTYERGYTYVFEMCCFRMLDIVI